MKQGPLYPLHATVSKRVERTSGFWRRLNTSRDKRHGPVGGMAKRSRLQYSQTFNTQGQSIAAFKMRTVLAIRKSTKYQQKLAVSLTPRLPKAITCSVQYVGFLSNLAMTAIALPFGISICTGISNYTLRKVHKNTNLCMFNRALKTWQGDNRRARN